MIDESMDKEAMKEEPKPWEFRSKPAWQRFFVMFGGVFFNFLLAILIYSASLYTWGEQYLKNDAAIYGVQCNDLAKEVGFRNGDKIISFDGNNIEKFQEIQIVLARNQAKTAEVIRDGEKITVTINPIYIPATLNTPGMFSLRIPFQLLAMTDSSKNLSAGLLPGDKIVAIDSIPANIMQDVQELLLARKGSNIIATIERNGQKFDQPLVVDANGLLGVQLDGDLSKFFTITNSHYSLLGAVPAGYNKTFSTIRNYLKELKLIFTPKTEAYKSVGSFIAIGNIFPSSWVWPIFWNLTAWLSIMLAVVNLLPIPALDGGHILFLIYEIVTRRKPSDKVLEYAQIAGMLLLFAIMFLAFGNDIYRLFK